MTQKLWHTPIKIAFSSKKLLHNQHFMALGSCFADNSSAFFTRSKIKHQVNPLGISFNPLSISRHLTLGIECHTIENDQIQSNSDLYFHYDFHGRFNSSKQNQVKSTINTQINKFNQSLKEIDVLILSLGTSIVYRLLDSLDVVNNCHKQDQKMFTKDMLSPEIIFNSLNKSLVSLKQYNPKLQVILTISPIRHAKDGFVQNLHSKANLIVAAHSLVNTLDFVNYFPAYEIMLDELRDYRFYARDMLHPSAEAIEYIFNKFLTACFTEKSQEVILEMQTFNKMLSHKTLHPSSKANKQFVESLKKKIVFLAKKYPGLDFEKEKKEYNLVP